MARIDSITASGSYAELDVGDKTYAVRERMQTLEEQLDPAVFFRIHRSAIVRLEPSGRKKKRRDSYVLNLPESNPVTWPHHRSRMTEKELTVFNRWRQRVGLPEV